MMYLLFIFLNFTEITQEICFYERDIFYKEIEGYTIPGLKGCDFINAVGEPCVPVKSFYFLLPRGTKVKEIKVISALGDTCDYKEIPLLLPVYPSQPPQVLSHKGAVQFVGPKEEVYRAKREYPGKIIEFKGEGNIHGERIAEILVYPLQWNPDTKKLKLYTSIKICIELIVGADSICDLELSRGVPVEVRELVNSVVLNPHPRQGQETFPTPLSQLLTHCEYVIITANSLVSSFEPLAEWKTAKGVPAIIRTTEWIGANYEGRDLAERIRNYLKCVRDSGIVWVLLGGDTEIIPSRTAYAMTCGESLFVLEDSLQADLYYSDLDGTWDANGNGIFGEIGDEVDMYPDVFVGRAPVSNAIEAQVFVNKTLKYEKNPPADYVTSALFFAEILWDAPYTDAGIAKDMIGELFPPSFNIERLYESLGNENEVSVINAMNSGKGLLNHDGHGFYYLMGVGPESEWLYNEDIDGLTNGDAQGLLYSIGCWVSAIDFDCIAEHWVKNPNGGGVAMIGNSRYGWGSPGNPGYGYSDKLDEQFFFNLFAKNITKVGQTLARTKIDYIAFSRSENVYRWHQYQVNLLGDPELSLWTEEPRVLEFACPESISIGENQIKLSLSVGADSICDPVCGARVCCFKENEVYEVDYTDELGEVNFDINPGSAGSLMITASCQGYYPSQKVLKVFEQGSCIIYYKHSISDSGGNGEINPGEKIDLSLVLKNTGAQEVYGVSGVLRTVGADSICDYVTLIDSTGEFGDISPGDTAFSDFSFHTADICTNGHCIQMELDLDGFDPVYLNLLIETPFLVYSACSLASTPYPGDVFKIWTTIKNYGGDAVNITGKLRSFDPYITILDSMQCLEALESDSSTYCSYIVQISPACPVPYFAELILNLIYSSTQPPIYSSTDTFLLEIGNEDLSYDFESGAAGWTTGGVPNSWQVTSYGAHSGTHSWYCGNPSGWNYENSANCWLKSPEFVLGPNSSLLFWTWLDIYTRGVDGLYVEVGKDSVWTKLDFIGSGGELLDSIPPNKDHFTIDWTPRTYDLSSYAVGCTVQVKFTFVSDEQDSAEGFYIDDVYVGAGSTCDDELPLLNRVCVEFRDSSANQIVEPGEKIICKISLIAENSDFQGVSGVLTSRDPWTTILEDDSVYWGDIKEYDIIKGSYSFRTDSSISYGHKIRFALYLRDGADYKHTSEFNVRIGQYIGIEDVGADSICDLEPGLYQNYPNPFVQSTVISYQLPVKSNVSLKVYDLAGRLVNILIDEVQDGGFYQIKWCAGDKVPGGVYFYRLETGDYTGTKKMFLIK